MVAFWFISVICLFFIVATTPGPNHILLTTTAANFSLRRTWGVLFGMVLGMQLIFWLIASGIGSLLLRYPQLYLILKVIGSGYLLWIAWKIANDKQEHTTMHAPSSIDTVSPFQALLLQFLNPKAWFMITGVSLSYIDKQFYMLSTVLMASILLIINTIVGIVWSVMGAFIRLILHSAPLLRIFNLLMGLLMASCIIFIWL